MKRTILISASLLLASAGCTCGQGRPNFLTRFNDRLHGRSNNVGEPCDAGCREAAMPAPVANSGCDGCGSAGSVSYGGYEQTGSSYEVPMGTPYSVGPATPYVPQTYPTVPATSRMEPVGAKRAN